MKFDERKGRQLTAEIVPPSQIFPIVDLVSDKTGVLDSRHTVSVLECCNELVHAALRPRHITTE
jgi:hypothetical protein